MLRIVKWNTGEMITVQIQYVDLVNPRVFGVINQQQIVPDAAELTFLMAILVPIPAQILSGKIAQIHLTNYVVLVRIHVKSVKTLQLPVQNAIQVTI